jgi:hypothetical protein
MGASSARRCEAASPDQDEVPAPAAEHMGVKALRATLSIAFGALFFAAGLAVGDFTGMVLMGLGAAAFLGAVS